MYIRCGMYLLENIHLSSSPNFTLKVEDMMNEVKFSQYVDTGKYVTSIGLGDFIKCELYAALSPALYILPSPLLDMCSPTSPPCSVCQPPSCLWAVSA